MIRLRGRGVWLGPRSCVLTTRRWVLLLSMGQYSTVQYSIMCYDSRGGVPGWVLGAVCSRHADGCQCGRADSTVLPHRLSLSLLFFFPFFFFFLQCPSLAILLGGAQVIWNSTTAVGCAKVISSDYNITCASKPIAVWSCDYHPAGNRQGTYPYSKHSYIQYCTCLLMQ